MSIYVAYTVLSLPTIESLKGYEFTMVPVHGSDAAYTEHLADRWRQGHTFINVEHDVVVPEGAIEALLACERPWCYHFYANHEGDFPFFGLVKFGAELIRDLPRVWDSMLAAEPSGHQPRWQICDTWLNMYPGRPEPHRHEPPAYNLRTHSHWRP